MSDNPKNQKNSETVNSELECMTRSVEKIRLTIDELVMPIRETRSILPRANLQLDSIANQTEAAATHMMDKLEEIIENQDKIGKYTEELELNLQKSADNESDRLTEQARKIISNAEISKNNAFHIIEALQFQDIASSHIDHVAGLLTDIEHRLHQLLGIIASSGLSGDHQAGEEAESTLPENKDQSEVDDIFYRITADKS